jgi:serine/threonine protein kinase
MLGTILGGRYEIIRHLGGGGFGQTYLAQDRQLPGQPFCVVKQLKPQATDSFTLETSRRLFDREAEVLYHLGNHSQIPRLLAHFEENQEFYLVQEYIEGHSLSQELRPQSRWTEQEVIDFLQDILNILNFVHQQNVIHRDIKPANLIRRNQDHKLVLIDFGAVKQIQSQVVNAHGETRLTVAVGTPGYMPNEQANGKPRFCSDIYAVGMIAIQALTGLSPHQFPEDPRTGEILWQEQVEISQSFAKILDKIICYDFRQRYQSAQEVLAEIQQLTLLNRQPTVTFSQASQNSQNTQPTLALSTVHQPQFPQPEKLKVEKHSRLKDWQKVVIMSSILGTFMVAGLVLIAQQPASVKLQIERNGNSYTIDRSPTPSQLSSTHLGSHSSNIIYLSPSRLTRVEDINKVCQTQGQESIFYTTNFQGVNFQGRMDLSIPPAQACNHDYTGTFIDRGSDGQICTGTVRYFATQKDSQGISAAKIIWTVQGDHSCSSVGEKIELPLYRTEVTP